MKLRTNVFHVALLEPAPKNSRLDKDAEAEDEEEEWDVEEIYVPCLAYPKSSFIYHSSSYNSELRTISKYV